MSIVSLDEARVRREGRSRDELDSEHADRSALAGAEREQFLERLAAFDRNTPAFIAREGGAWWDTRDGLLLRVDAVIADLLDQLAGEAQRWPA